MPPPLSAGILLFRMLDEPEVLLVKPGGPFWRGKDAGAWMIPKGMVEPGETPEQAALREFEEEVGTRLQAVPKPLCTVRQAGGKVWKRSQFKATSIRPPCAATPSRWNGRPAAGSAKLFRRWPKRAGCGWNKRAS